MPKFEIGDRVIRVGEGLEATVIGYMTFDGDYYYNLYYDEGGTGWWNENTLAPVLTRI
jgi:hypothetical protein